MGRARIIADLVGFSTDSGVLNFGADKEITLTHDPDDGLILKHAATADDSFPELTFQTGDTDIAVNDLLGRINFQAPDEGAGTDAILVAGAIAAISEGDFSSSANATSLIFQTGASETATTKMTLSSGGNLDVTGDITGSTLNADGDTAAGDNAAIGYTAAEGLILTGQGSTNDVTIKNDADTEVMGVATGATVVDFASGPTVADVAIKVAGKESIWVPAGAMYPSTTNGCAGIEQVETTALRPDLNVLDFDASSDEFAQFSIAFPKSWNEGTVTFQPYWTVTGTNTGTVAWQLGGIAVSSDDTINTAFGTLVATTALAHSGTSNDLMVSVESGAVTIAGSAAEADQVFFQINRDISADNQTGDARLLGVKLFFTIDAATDA